MSTIMDGLRQNKKKNSPINEVGTLLLSQNHVVFLGMDKLKRGATSTIISTSVMSATSAGVFESQITNTVTIIYLSLKTLYNFLHLCGEVVRAADFILGGLHQAPTPYPPPSPTAP